MDLKSLAAAAGVVPLTNGTKIPVRGLGLPDIFELAKGHKAQLESVFNTLKGTDFEESVDSTSILEGLIETSPDLVGEIILLATDSDDSVEDAKRLPAGLQLAILEEVGRQTFVTEGGLGKTLEIVINMISGTTQTLADLNSPTR